MSRFILILIAAALAYAQEPQFAPGRQPRRAAAAPKPNFFGLGPAPDPAAVDRGQKLYVSQCGFCHGSNGKGGSGGPDLVRSVVVLHDEGTTTEVGPVIRQGRPAKGMPKFAMSDAQIKDISAFLYSLIRGTIIRGDYKILNLATGDAGKGRAFFEANCTACHSATGDLARVATKFDQPTLLTRFLYPRSRTPKAKETATVTLPSGETVTGEMNWIDDFSVGLTDSSGQIRSWERSGGVKVDVKDPLEGHEKLLARYSDADMHDILTYLVTLK